MLRQMFKPDLYHGKTPWNHFEGWYFKIVNRDATESFAFIPGVFWGRSRDEAHGFIQVLEGTAVNYNYHRFKSDDFIAHHSPLEIHLLENVFSLEGMTLGISTPQQEITGSIKFSNLVPWQDKPYSPGSMGYFNFIPFMQCYSQVCAMGMDLSGSLTIDSVVYDFNGGKGYIEKNWGNAFPYSWVWIQSNSFSDYSTSLSCSIAHIPFWFTSFRGFLVALYHKNTFYQFTTMKGATLSIKSQGSDVIILLKNKQYQLLIQTEGFSDSFILCKGPRNGKMIPLVKECLRGKVTIHLSELITGKTILEDIGCATGIEYGGEQMKLLDN